jgi:plasmid segregation protein ParM
MKEWIEAPHSLQNIILVGGGAFLFRKAVKAAFPKHRIHEVKEPMFANVQGFSAGRAELRAQFNGSHREGARPGRVGRD